MNRLLFMVLGLGLFFCAMTSTAQAQASRTWISGVGDDANPCSRTAPCKTFAGAYTKTATGGEIDVIDPGGFGAFSISHALTVDGGGGVMASVLNSNGGNGIVINAAGTDVVTLRNLWLNGISQYIAPGGSGIVMNSGRLIVEHCMIENWSQYGIYNNAVAATSISVNESSISNAGVFGIYAKTTSGLARVSVFNSVIYNSAGGLWANQGASVQIKHSVIANNKGGDGILADPQGTGTALVTAVDDSIMGNQTGVHANAGGFIRIGMDTITDNNYGLVSAPPSGKIQSWQDNDLFGNVTSDGAPDTPNLTKV
jgi:Right handed beta helix region